ncbi:MAG TPA: 5-(carboxyamino)imidazole ribonucleotide synthase [Solirubrobacteraceae bacterium]|nr:5-(carboxyamino)imidazole ribonucleotide synthase [Solirubrobacteraceae bacterium]
MTGRRPTVAMVGAGQLARMAWQSAIDLDVDLVCLATGDDAAIRAGAQLLEGSAREADDLRALAARGDVLTFEHELVDLTTLRELEAEGVVVRPSADVLALAVDKLHQRRTLRAWGLPVPAFAPAPDPGAVQSFAAEHGARVVLKAVSGGYDGRGVWMCETQDEVDRAFADAHAGGLELYVETAVVMAGEAAIMVARSPSGAVKTYPMVATRQVDGMCREVVLGAETAVTTEVAAAEIAVSLARHVRLEGLMAVELFITPSGEVLINELALRAHNTGHIHTEAAVTSQFEQHLRAVLDLPLGDPAPTVLAAAMVNIVGPADGSDPADHRGAALAVPGAHIHLYGKGARPGRKLGHVTVCADTPEKALALARRAADALEGAGEAHSAPAPAGAEAARE